MITPFITIKITGISGIKQEIFTKFVTLSCIHRWKRQPADSPRSLRDVTRISARVWIQQHWRARMTKTKTCYEAAKIGMGHLRWMDVWGISGKKRPFQSLLSHGKIKSGVSWTVVPATPKIWVTVWSEMRNRLGHQLSTMFCLLYMLFTFIFQKIASRQ